jgi:hypothetical protein
MLQLLAGAHPVNDTLTSQTRLPAKARHADKQKRGSMTQLAAEFHGMGQIVDLWFANYKRPDGG